MHLSKYSPEKKEQLLIVSSLPKNWNIPDWASEHFVRQVIGEGIPPLLVKKILSEMVTNYA